MNLEHRPNDPGLVGLGRDVIESCNLHSWDDQVVEQTSDTDAKVAPSNPCGVVAFIHELSLIVSEEAEQLGGLLTNLGDEVLGQPLGYSLTHNGTLDPGGKILYFGKDFGPDRLAFGSSVTVIVFHLVPPTIILFDWDLLAMELLIEERHSDIIHG